MVFPDDLYLQILSTIVPRIISGEDVSKPRTHHPPAHSRELNDRELSVDAGRRAVPAFSPRMRSGALMLRQESKAMESMDSECDVVVG